MSFFAFLASKRKLCNQVQALQELFDASIQDHAATQRELARVREDFANLNASCRELLEMGCVLQQERDAARRVAADALTVAGFKDTLNDINRLPEWGTS